MRNIQVHFKSAARLLGVAIVVGLLASSTCAYTLILRDGRHLEIPASFSVTSTAVTYELAPGFQKSLMMIVIDVPATERANNEQPGTFLKRAGMSDGATNVQAGAATRSITNRDLQQYARMRKQNEQAFDERQKQLGLPSLEELREQRRQEDEREWQELKERRARIEAENQALQTRTELQALETELSTLRNSIDGTPSYANSGLITYGTIFPFGSSFPSRFRGFNRFGFEGVRNSNLLFGSRNRRLFVTPRGVLPLASRFGFGGRSGRTGVFIGPTGGHRR